MRLKEIRGRPGEVGNDSKLARGTRKLLQRHQFLEMSIHARQCRAAGTLFKYWDMPAKRGLLKFPQAFLYRDRKKEFSLRYHARAAVAFANDFLNKTS